MEGGGCDRYVSRFCFVQSTCTNVVCGVHTYVHLSVTQTSGLVCFIQGWLVRSTYSAPYLTIPLSVLPCMQ